MYKEGGFCSRALTIKEKRIHKHDNPEFEMENFTEIIGPVSNANQDEGPMQHRALVCNRR